MFYCNYKTKNISRYLGEGVWGKTRAATMKLFAGDQAPQQLLHMLGTALQRQEDKWTQNVYKQPVNKVGKIYY